MEDMNAMERDALTECANVGIGNAASALSVLLKKRIDISIPETKLVDLHLFADEIGGRENLVSGISLRLQGDLEGDVLFIFDCEDAMEMIDLLLGRPQEESEITELEKSGFCEMANIVTGSYLNALAAFLDMKILPGVPSFATDMVQSLVDFVLIDMGKHADRLLMVKTSMSIEGKDVSGAFVMIFRKESLDMILQKLHDKYGV